MRKLEKPNRLVRQAIEILSNKLERSRERKANTENQRGVRKSLSEVLIMIWKQNCKSKESHELDDGDGIACDESLLVRSL